MGNTENLTPEEGAYLLSIARKTIEQRLFNHNEDSLNATDVAPGLMEKRGTFVTLSIHKRLRGCIGHIIPHESIIEGIRLNAINAAFKDPRFNPITKREWPDVRIDISILTEPKMLEYSDAHDLVTKLRANLDGIIIKKGLHQATFLPQVWEQLPHKRDFLTHLCMKAGLPGDAWESEHLEVHVYQAQVFEEHE